MGSVRVGAHVSWAYWVAHRASRCAAWQTTDTEVTMNRPLSGPGRDEDPRRIEPRVDERPVDDQPAAVEERVVTRRARTSAAAAFALAFGVAASCVC